MFLLALEKENEIVGLLAVDVDVVIVADTVDVEDTNYAVAAVVNWLHEHVLPLQHGDVAREADLVDMVKAQDDVAQDLLVVKAVAKVTSHGELLNLKETSKDLEINLYNHPQFTINRVPLLNF